MKFNNKQGLGTAAVAAIVIAVAILAAAGAYVLSSGAASTLTITSTSVSTSVTTSTTTTLPSVSVTLNGAGSTFIQPVLNAMISQYQMATPTVAINYQGVGSGAGIAALEGHTVDFAASDVPLQAADQA